jgi:hypothetical protein
VDKRDDDLLAADHVQCPDVAKVGDVCKDNRQQWVLYHQPVLLLAIIFAGE